MTTTAVNAVGFCAHYSRQGDWAFEFALALARSRDAAAQRLPLPLRPVRSRRTGRPEGLEPETSGTASPIERERELRLYYDGRLGDYLDVGFRLCEDREWTELHRCLTPREFQVLVLGRPDYGVELRRQAAGGVRRHASSAPWS